MLEVLESVAQTSLSDGSGNGVAPLPGSLYTPVNEADIMDAECAWLVECANGWQFGEQGVIDAIVDRLEWAIPVEDRWAVEFGCGDGVATRLMCQHVTTLPGWRSLLIEAEGLYFERFIQQGGIPDGVVVLNNRVEISGHNSIDDHMQIAQCAANPAVMVVDVDSADYYIVEAMASRPYILCVETLDMCSQLHKDNADKVYVPTVEECGKEVPRDIGQDNQANTTAMNALMHSRGYKLVYRSRVNSIYVRGDMVPHLRKVKLNLGCGDKEVLGYIGLDLKKGNDIRKLDFADASVDEVYASHVLEHFSHAEIATVLKEWARVLKPGGVMRIAVPDVGKIIEQHKSDDPIGGHAFLQAVIYGGDTDKNDRHWSSFTRETLTEAMNKAGIGFVTDFKPFNLTDCSNLKYSLNLEGVKRWYPKLDKPKICLVLSQPKFAFTGHEKCLIQLANKIGFDVQESCGAFWDRDITLATMAAINRFDPDFLMYSDYDSVFEADDVLKLIEALNNDPTMAAIGSVQMSRHNDRPLVLDGELDFSKPLTKVRFQHFGLTLVRREVYDELRHPWYWSVPGKNEKGEWDWTAWAKSDADITFWRSLELMGFNVYQHNEVCIGHIIQAVKYPRDSGKGVQLIPIENYWRCGKPKDAKLNAALYAPKTPETVAPTTPSEPVKTKDKTLGDFRTMGIIPSGEEVPPSEHTNA